MAKVLNQFRQLSTCVKGNDLVANVCNKIAKLNPIFEKNFDIESIDWGVISDQSSFETFLFSQGATSVIVSDFELVSGRLSAYLNVEGVDILNLSNKKITNVFKIGGFSASLQFLILTSNEIVTFNPVVSLPDSLQYLYLVSNKIAIFNPSIALPSGLNTLDLSNNIISNFNPSIALPSNLQAFGLGGNQIVIFNPSIALPSNLQAFGLESNQIVTFNPSISLPSNLQLLTLNDNQMTELGYENSEPWAILQTFFINPCNIYFNANIDSVTGTNLETILISKNCIINA